MYAPPGVKTDSNYPIPDSMKAWVLGDPGQLALRTKPVPVPKRAEVLVRIDAVAICATDLEIIYHGPPASIQGGLPFNKSFPVLYYNKDLFRAAGLVRRIEELAIALQKYVHPAFDPPFTTLNPFRLARSTCQPCSRRSRISVPAQRNSPSSGCASTLRMPFASI